MASSGNIVDLRALLAERFPAAPRSPHEFLATGLPAFDRECGLQKGAITEVISPRISCGSASFIAALVQAAHRDRYFLALIDSNDSFDPQPLGNAALRHLLWVRCHTTVEVIKSADFLLRDGNFPLVIIDLVLSPTQDIRKIPQTSWYRLQRLVEATSTALLVFTRSNTVSSARLKAVLENRWTLETVRSENPASSLRVQMRRLHGTHDPSIRTVAG